MKRYLLGSLALGVMLTGALAWTCLRSQPVPSMPGHVRAGARAPSHTETRARLGSGVPGMPDRAKLRVLEASARVQSRDAFENVPLHRRTEPPAGPDQAEPGAATGAGTNESERRRRHARLLSRACQGRPEPDP